MARRWADQITPLYVSRLCVIAILGISSAPLRAVASVESSVSMKILSLCDRAGKYESTANGALELRLVNQSREKLWVLLCCPRGSVKRPSEVGAPLDTEKIRDYYTGTDEFADRPSGTAFATISYDWTDLKGQKVLSSSYDVADQTIDLGKGKIGRLCVPVRLPPNAGSYELRVTFDNRALKPILQTNGIVPSRLAFFESSARVSITIPDSDHHH